MTELVSAPGRWILPIASLSAGEWTFGTRRARNAMPKATSLSTTKAPAVATRKLAAMNLSSEDRIASAAISRKVAAAPIQ